MINIHEVLETNHMIEKENLDVRTITIGISLLSCIDSDLDRLNEKIGSYSRGMIRKLLLSRAVMTAPKLAIMDEATSGLDVINALDIRRTIKKLAREQGMSFLLSSHNMLEIEYISDRVGIVAGGKLLSVGTISELKEQFGAENLEEVFEKVVTLNERKADI